MTPSPGDSIGRRLTINTVVRRQQIEATRDRWLWEDESERHSAALIDRFSTTVRDAIPDARITWALSWGALTDDSARYAEVRREVARCAETFGDDVTFVPGGFFPNLHGSRDAVARDIADAVALIEDEFQRETRSLVAGFLSAENTARAREELGIRTVQGNIWSQFDIDLQDGDGSVAYPYRPSRAHFLRPARGDDRIDVAMLDGWTVDLVAARAAGMGPDGTGFNSRLGLGPIETLHRLPRADALAELEATSAAHLGAPNVERNGLGWLTVNYEISEVHRGLETDPGLLDAWGGWLASLRSEWPDLRVTPIADFGAEWSAANPDDAALAYLLRQEGSGVQASTLGERVTWFMCADFRLGVVDGSSDPLVFDYTDYRPEAHEPTELGDRRWSLLGEINQKRTRAQDAPQPIGSFLAQHPEVLGGLRSRWGARAELAELLP
ncbi:DUF3863 domain-containing protein [Herbiconiux sp. KACC 21604]|uniref:DUF3863 domain-containing protein n=1 Tax=unclassified Herbiconiux TaxID=2618217 RepID=UPI001491B0B5|nr:DUF3863 domain-containing protein [Herbiconiux sp. SALV-R1]QJU55743.1 DUF3863 domain-containing protein [Herbiconiux sp. SALV-R1]WPO86951.1 DUF3863 domain-containing protein [Herbiconiux sp. KACC 21604]